MGAHFEALIEGVLMASLDSRYTQVGFNFISVQVCILLKQVLRNFLVLPEYSYVGAFLPKIYHVVFRSGLSAAMSLSHFSAGGLVTAVAPVVIENNGLWIGWTGLHDFDEEVDRSGCSFFLLFLYLFGFLCS